MDARELLIKAATTGGRIVCSGDLNVWQIAEAQRLDLWFVDEQTAFGFAILPWDLTTDNDRQREKGFLTREQHSKPPQ